jgi:hypothetical protein
MCEAERQAEAAWAKHNPEPMQPLMTLAEQIKAAHDRLAAAKEYHAGIQWQIRDHLKKTRGTIQTEPFADTALHASNVASIHEVELAQLAVDSLLAQLRALELEKVAADENKAIISALCLIHDALDLPEGMADMQLVRTTLRNLITVMSQPLGSNIDTRA